MTRNLPAWILRSPTLARANGLIPAAPRAPVMPLPIDAPKRRTKTDPAKLKLGRKRQQRLIRAGLCINGLKHGKATHGVRCKRCHEVHGGSRDTWKKRKGA